MLKSFEVVILFLLIGLFGCGQRQPVPPTASADHSSTGDQATQSDAHAGHSYNEAPSKVDHGPHGGHENMPVNTARPRTLLVKTEPSQPTAGSTTKLSMRIQDAEGTPIESFDVLHEKPVHLIVVRDGLDEFAHLHPDVDRSGMITTQFAFPKSGKYRLFADHQPQGQSAGLAIGEVNVSGSDERANALVATESPEITIGEIKAHIAVRKNEQETNLQFHFVDADSKPVSDLQPYLGAMGHLVIISEDGSEYVHAHPLSAARTAPNGAVEFAAHFSKRGIYKAWGQFQRNGTVFTVPYVLKHEANLADAGAQLETTATDGHQHSPGGQGMMRGPGMQMGMGPGMMSGGEMNAMRTDAMGLHALLNKRERIERRVRDLPNGVETVTESVDPAVAMQIREHVAAMYKRLEDNAPLPMMSHDSLFIEVFKHAKQIRLELEDTPTGLKVIETSEDPYVVRLIQAHSRVVDAFIANGIDEVHRKHEVPSEESIGGTP